MEYEPKDGNNLSFATSVKATKVWSFIHTLPVRVYGELSRNKYVHMSLSLFCFKASESYGKHLFFRPKSNAFLKNLQRQRLSG